MSLMFWFHCMSKFEIFKHSEIYPTRGSSRQPPCEVGRGVRQFDGKRRGHGYRQGPVVLRVLRFRCRRHQRSSAIATGTRRDFTLLPPAYVVCGKVMISVVSVCLFRGALMRPLWTCSNLFTWGLPTMAQPQPQTCRQTGGWLSTDRPPSCFD